MGKRGTAIERTVEWLFSQNTARSIPIWRRNSNACSMATGRGMGQRTAHLCADAKGLPPAIPPAKFSMPLPRIDPWLMGGSADLYPSTKTRLTFDGAGDFEGGNYNARNFHFGIREHAMGAIVNGMTLSKIRAYGSTFLIFSDYMKMPIRLSAIMEIPSIWIFTHDSIGVGEDGPTHQPIEQLVTLRAVPGLMTLRPADANEVSSRGK
jgi:transketolase